MRFPLIISLCLLSSATRGFGEQAAPIVQQQDAPSVGQILDRMKAHDKWQERYLVEYQAQRKFYAANSRFNEEATLEVKTTFRQPDILESQVLRAEGSKLIRERVFNKILEAEKETRPEPARQQIAIEEANYSFSHLAQEDCAGRKCYRLDITPLRKDKYLIKGQIWVDAEDWGIARVQGSPVKRPSFWARQTLIDHRYKRIDGLWLDDVMESTTDVLVAGRSTLKIQYTYESIQTDPPREALNKSAMQK